MSTKLIHISYLFLIFIFGSIFSSAQTEAPDIEYSRFIRKMKEDLNANKDDKERLNKQLSEKKAEINSKNDQLSKKQLQVQNLQKKVNDRQAEEFNIKEQVKNKNFKISSNNQRIDQLKSENSSLRSSIETREAELQLKAHEQEFKKKKSNETRAEVDKIHQEEHLKKQAFQSKKQQLTDIETNNTQLVNQLNEKTIERNNVSDAKKQLELRWTEIHKQKNEHATLLNTIQTKEKSLQTKKTQNISSLQVWENELALKQQESNTLTQKVLQQNEVGTSNETTFIPEEKEKNNVDKTKTNARLAVLKTEIEKLKNDIQTLKKENELLNQDIQNTQLEYSRTKSISDTLALAEKSNLNAREENQFTLNQLNTLIEKLGNSKEKSSIELQSIRVEVQMLEREVSTIDSKRISLQKDLDRLISESSSAESMVSSLSSKIEHDKGVIAKNEKEITTLESENLAFAQEIPSLELKLPEILSEILDSSSRLELIKSESDTWKKDIQKITDELAVLNRELKNSDNPIIPELNALFDLALKKEHKITITTAEKIKSSHPQRFETYLVAGYTYFISGDKTKGIEYMDKGLILNPTYQSAYFVKADMDEQMKNYRGAVKNYTLILVSDSTNTRALSNRARIYKEFLNDWDNACNDWAKLVAYGHFESNELLSKNCGANKPTFYSVTQITKESLDPTYGYTPENPIKVGKDKNGRNGNVVSYLNLLRDGKGGNITYRKLGTCCPYDSKNGVGGKALLEKYDLEFKDTSGNKVTKTIYLSFFDYELPKIPLGMTASHSVY